MATAPSHWLAGMRAAAASGDSAKALRAIARLLARSEGEGMGSAHDLLVQEARDFFGTGTVALLSVAETEGLVEVAAIDPAGEDPHELLSLEGLPPVSALLSRSLPSLVVEDEVAALLARELGMGRAVRSMLLLPMRQRLPIVDVLVLAGSERFGPNEVDLARAFADAAAVGLAQLRRSEHLAAWLARQSTLARAAKTLNETLDVSRVLARICEESAQILDADSAAMYIKNGGELRLQAVYGREAAAVGTKLGIGEGLVGKAVEHDEAMLTNDYQALPVQGQAPHLSEIRSCLAVPLHWDGKLRGALSVAYTRPYLVTRDHLELLEAFGDLAATACGNASQHAGAVVAARTDSLTGCLNHVALQHALAGELTRGARTASPVSFVLLDLDDFKQVNDEHGHLTGDEVLRRVGAALRACVRPYDAVGRYGGDEFAIVAAVGEEEAEHLATRALQGIEDALADTTLPITPCRATAGVAEWDGQEGGTRLIERADRALLHGKHGGRRGVAIRASEVPGSQAAFSESR
jgi:diguanylate cyclase (GGDEF)-like protein